MKTIQLPDDFDPVSPLPKRGLDMLRVVDKYGPLTVIAAALIWWLVTDISGDMRVIKHLLEVHTIESNFYLRQICINGAKDDAQRMNCQQPERGH